MTTSDRDQWEAVARELARDSRMLDAVEQGAPAAFRAWTTSAVTVVVGRSVVVAAEVDERLCRRRGVAVVRRASGGRSVVIGPGTLQYAFALPYALSKELGSIAGAKRFCNRLLIAGLAEAAPHAAGRLEADPSGDLVLAGRKVGGLAMRRRKYAMLLHGTILVSADIETIARLLRHPASEPHYRRGRSHRAFLRNLGALDAQILVRTVRNALGRLASSSRRSSR